MQHVTLTYVIQSLGWLLVWLLAGGGVAMLIGRRR